MPIWIISTNETTDAVAISLPAGFFTIVAAVAFLCAAISIIRSLKQYGFDMLDAMMYIIGWATAAFLVMGIGLLIFTLI